MMTRSMKYHRYGSLIYKYSLIRLGDLDLDQGLGDSNDIYPIFVMFTFVITIVMVNMLIAIASDSYANTKENGPKLFRILRLY